MKQNIHPEYHEIKATCSCGNIIEMKSTLAEALQLDVCSECHPFYTGKQKLVDTAGRIDKFEKRFGKKKATKSSKESSQDSKKTSKSSVKVKDSEAPLEESVKVIETPLEESVEAPEENQD